MQHWHIWFPQIQVATGETDSLVKDPRAYLTRGRANKGVRGPAARAKDCGSSMHPVVLECIDVACQIPMNQRALSYDPLSLRHDA